MEEEITQAVKNNIVRRSFRSLVPKNPFRSIHVPSSSSKFIDEALSLRPVVSAFAPLAAASAPRPDNSPSNPCGGRKGEAAGAVSAPSSRNRGRSRDFSPAFRGVLSRLQKWTGLACGEGWKGERVDGRWWKEGEELILDGRLACGMCRLTTPFESVDGCAPLWQRLFRKPAGYETDLARLRKRGERGRIKC